jgi:hypothetical protein
MKIRLRKSASVALLTLASAAPLLADGGQWTNRFWGLGWGDGYHAPPRTGGPHLPGSQGHGASAHGHRGHALAHAGGRPDGLMPGGYPDRGQYDESYGTNSLPEWLWDPSDETVIVDTAQPTLPAESDPVPPPPQSSTKKPARDPSLGLPPAIEPTERTDSRAMLRRGPIQARSAGWSR